MPRLLDASSYTASAAGAYSGGARAVSRLASSAPPRAIMPPGPRSGDGARPPRDEGARAALVVRIARPALRDRALEHRDAGDAQQQDGHRNRSDHTEPGEGRGDRDDEHAPVREAVAEVVGVARVAPEAAVHHVAAVRRLGAETGQLPVADGLEAEPDRVEQDARGVERTEPVGARRDLRELER